MEHLPWSAIVTLGLMVLGGAAAWGQLRQKIQHHEDLLKECKGKPAVAEANCERCRAQIMKRMDQDIAALHEYMLKTNERLGRVDGIISRHDLELKS